MFLLIFFFFQAEDGIRDTSVTGVQTCALPISMYGTSTLIEAGIMALKEAPNLRFIFAADGPLREWCEKRSEERRVGKECRSEWSPDHGKKKKIHDNEVWMHRRTHV